jgi:hypothetical protein
MLALALIALLSPLAAAEAAAPGSTPLTLSVKTITIRTGFRCDHCQNIPYGLVTAGGHYLLNPYQRHRRFYLVYDGRVLRRLDDYYRVPVMALSQNGLHYAYAIEGGSLYLDGHVRPAPGHITALAISNDGRHVYYAADHIPNAPYWANVLVRDGKPILRRAAGLADFWISADGSSYAAEGPNGSLGMGAPTVFLNGKVVYDSPRSKDHGQILLPVYLSRNGKHYGYTLVRIWGVAPGRGASWMKAVVDGQVRQMVTDPHGSVTRILLQVTGAGHYPTCDGANHSYLDTRRYPGSCPIYITDDARHVLVDGARWTLDGRPVGLSPRQCCDEVDLDHGMVYNYRTVT